MNTSLAPKLPSNLAKRKMEVGPEGKEGAKDTISHPVIKILKTQLSSKSKGSLLKLINSELIKTGKITISDPESLTAADPVISLPPLTTPATPANDQETAPEPETTPQKGTFGVVGENGSTNPLFGDSFLESNPSTSQSTGLVGGVISNGKTQGPQTLFPRL